MKKKYFKNLISIYILIISTGIMGFNILTLNSSPLWNNKIENFTIFSSGIPNLPWENNGVAICTQSESQHFPQICNDGVEGAIITWADYRTGSISDIYAQLIDSNGLVQWTTDGVIICTASGYQNNPQICSDGAGGAIIVWHDKRSGTHWDIYAQRINSNGLVQWTPNGVAICSISGDQMYPQICSDGVGGAIITWQDKWNGVDFDIYTQRVNSTGDLKWEPTGLAICTASNNQEAPQICSDEIGGAIITWKDARNGNTDIYVQRVNLTGSVQWMSNGTAVCTTSENQQTPQICSDEAGGSIITWKDYRGIDGDIYAQCVNSTGDVKWANNGIVICDARSAQLDPQICKDGFGGANIVWSDYRSLASSDIYAQRINSTGSAQWVANGIAICTQSESQQNPQICSDGAGGAIIIWFDGRNGLTNSEIYVQRANSTGSVQWAANGTAICEEEHSQEAPQICSDGAGGAFTTWEDYRGASVSGYDIYANFIKNFLPTSNHPEDIITSVDGSETINWTLYDDSNGGQYHVLVNYTNTNYYEWITWTPWSNASSLVVPINRTIPGIYNYIIEYYDDQNQLGISDTVIVEITGMTINGYNILIILSSSFAIVIVLSRKIKKNRTNKATNM